MTQEDKQLLLKDLCARLPYGVIIQEYNEEYGYSDNALNTISIGYFSIHEASIEGTWINHIENVKPYLRPLSSMTEEEAKELSILYGLKDILSIKKITDEYIEVVVDDGFCSTETRAIWYDEIISSIEIFDWLNAHYFDYRGLIEKGLAIAATEENNPYK